MEQTEKRGRTGCLHVYYGEGKGKTTAAVGLAVRALGHGIPVTVVHFLKDGTSGEAEMLRRLGAEVLFGIAGGRFVSSMTEEEKRETARICERNLRIAMEGASRLLVLDELCAARRLGMVDEQLAREAVLLRPSDREVVITGRNPEAWMLEQADYITWMQAVKHPYSSGLSARAGVEY